MIDGIIAVGISLIAFGLGTFAGHVFGYRSGSRVSKELAWREGWVEGYRKGTRNRMTMH